MIKWNASSTIDCHSLELYPLPTVQDTIFPPNISWFFYGADYRVLAILGQEIIFFCIEADILYRPVKTQFFGHQEQVTWREVFQQTRGSMISHAPASH